MKLFDVLDGLTFKIEEFERILKFESIVRSVKNLLHHLCVQ